MNMPPKAVRLPLVVPIQSATSTNTAAVAQRISEAALSLPE